MTRAVLSARAKNVRALAPYTKEALARFGDTTGRKCARGSGEKATRVDQPLGKRVSASTLPKPVRQHVANAVYRAVKNPRNFKTYTRGEAVRFSLLGAHSGPPAEVMGSGLTCFAFRDTPAAHTLAVEHVYAVYLDVVAYDLFLKFLERRGHWHHWQVLLKSDVRTVWNAKPAQPSQRRPEPFMRRNPGVSRAAAVESTELLRFCVLIEVTEDAVAEVELGRSAGRMNPGAPLWLRAG